MVFTRRKVSNLLIIFMFAFVFYTCFVNKLTSRQATQQQIAQALFQHHIDVIPSKEADTTEYTYNTPPSSLRSFVTSDLTTRATLAGDSHEPKWTQGKDTDKPSMLIGIPSIRRNQSDYLYETLSSLIKEQSSTSRNDVVFLVYIADSEDTIGRKRAAKVYELFGDALDEGRIKIISPPAVLYPDWESKLLKNFGDGLNRVKWRSKQNLDMKHLLTHAIDHFDPTYFLMMEDDLLARRNYDKVILEFAEEKPTAEWAYCSFTWVGGAGKLFHRESMREFRLLLEIFWNAKPLDWLMWDYVGVKMCGHDLEKEECRTKREELIRHARSTLFTHIGKESSRSNPHFGIH